MGELQGAHWRDRDPHEGCVYAKKPREGARLRSEGTVSRSRGPWKEGGGGAVRGSFRRHQVQGVDGEAPGKEEEEGPERYHRFRPPLGLRPPWRLWTHLILPVLEFAQPRAHHHSLALPRGTSNTPTNPLISLSSLHLLHFVTCSVLMPQKRC